jgi:hypothetical protein
MFNLRFKRIICGIIMYHFQNTFLGYLNQTYQIDQQFDRFACVFSMLHMRERKTATFFVLVPPTTTTTIPPPPQPPKCLFHSCHRCEWRVHEWYAGALGAARHGFTVLVRRRGLSSLFTPAVPTEPRQQRVARARAPILSAKKLMNRAGAFIHAPRTRFPRRRRRSLNGRGC